jgi:transcriptional regulator of NAD metabolism
MSGGCGCFICKRYDEIEDIKNRGDVEELKRLVDTLTETLINTETDRDHYHAILTGHWPHAKDYLEAALKKMNN